MENKLEYAIVYDYSHDLQAFTDTVNDYLESGWSPQGGICATNGELYQAIYKRIE